MTTHQAIRTPTFTGPAGWSAILPPAAPRAPLQGDTGCDIVIVGGGFAGLAAARRLHQIDPALRVVILDAARIAEGGTGRNSGFMIDLPHDLTSGDYAGSGDGHGQQLTQLNRHAIEFAAGCVAEYGIPDGFFQRAGKINGAASDGGAAANAAYARHLSALNEPHQVLDAQDMRRITGSSYYRGGLYTPGTVMIQPAGYVRGLAAGLQRQGVTIHENSAVTRIDSTQGGWTARTAQGSVTAQKLILAANGHLESFGFKRGQLMHIMLNACITEELDPAAIRALGGQDCWGITPADPMGTTVRRIGPAQGGNRIVIRQGAYYRPGMQTSRADLQRLVGQMRRKFDARFPMLKGIRFAHSWSGHLCLARNDVSVMRELETGLYAACVDNGLGTTRSTLTGIGAAELACGLTSPITEFFGAQAEPSPLPPHPFDTIGANAYLRWKEWRTRRE
ncbi:NAD(P)/FAD-dependent oxidoreductase [Paracoccus shanxieyensis]|uniref:FAD-dependent oxidoreductase n=1 Tax=Paracoccus shanxieyensis TaxID=2675752 RepID=A0A6L6IS22_9RHOB|nr:FAD-binding oxidoreductase [Paracoccus shanxieyensis]MTH62963.1 FAD-dependent oxidoreductase [Paracoccus shanxieyensis]MTH85953.1 FAD-dependent oxidoreductase [Paracoccus shanxieyensis]